MAPTFVQFAFSTLLVLSSFTRSNASPASFEKRALIVPNDLPTGWSSLGCYTDSVAARTFTGATYADTTGLTDEKCVAFCISKGFIYAGTEYSQECFCGNAFSNGGAVAATADCSMACSGAPTQPCGGPNRLNVFKSSAPAPAGPVTNPGPTGWGIFGCYTDSVAARTLPVGVPVAGGANAMTVELCVAACAGYTYAGVEYASECYCGNAFANGGGPAADGYAGCNMPCNGNTGEYCGGNNRLDVYKAGLVVSSSSTTSGPATSSTTTRTATTTTSLITSTGTGTASGIPAPWKYAGCYVDGVDGRILRFQNPDSAALTIESCVQSCISQGYKVAGMEYSAQCFCDNYIVNGGMLASADTQCAMTCSGNANEICGGPNRVSVYSNGTLQVMQAPTAQKTGLPGSWQYVGCLLDSIDVRSLPYELDTNLNSPGYCLSLCSEYGYSAGGMEYGLQCFCGDVSDVTAAGATLQPETDCNTVCPGNVTTLCGAGNRMTYYNWVGTPLHNWHYAAGNTAGAYQFLIGGVVTPLITTPGVNGKVMFVEKFGTGPPNSTGAYELDLTQINNFEAAWRPLHVKTDVFCSAGLTLPDRVGRQINVGGWSGVSTFGIRLYWPDGSPGVPGVNDWQENSAELQLQAGRWYPSAMIMANGSILVVGGEDGSNGAPVPSIEVLPKPAGGLTTITMDWLQRTDPYNLYPFLAVLPSGGIFVGYYNEARILNPATFATTKTLPNIPAAVNNPLGGRTYPLEGTMVLLPQSAPYTAPLQVLMCGGSTPFSAVALDNCVSIAPDAANPQWVIERMPSKRVISSMTALPDGTYLILNGGQQGVAGFALASEPNHNAVLYDPRQPVGSRFTVMANTTITRLYHSEAVLLDDARVLVSGSDPQDARFPEEYRVEVFVPPYILSGAARPAFTIQNKDWTYGASVPITITAGSTANLKVSLLGAVSSTHGNSMGQRTLFPAVSCAGATCTITAPPNANICPPGWFQLFVLDGPTPSVAHWVRIGGDPANLGNWPNFPDFNLPGVGAVGATASIQSLAIESGNSTISGNLTRRGF